MFILALSLIKISAISKFPFFTAAKRGVSEKEVRIFTSGLYLRSSCTALVLLLATASIRGVAFSDVMQSISAPFLMSQLIAITTPEEAASIR